MIINIQTMKIDETKDAYNEANVKYVLIRKRIVINNS